LSDEKPLLSAAIRHLADRQRRALTEHPTAAELTAYHAGELPPEAESRLREHLALCRDCSDLLLDLAGFADLTPPPGVPELTDDEVEQDWQALRARLGEAVKGEPRPAPVVPIRRAVPARSEREFSPWKVLAAASLAAVVGLSAWVALRPSPGGPVVVFDDEEQVRSGGEDRLQHMSSSQPGVFSFYSQGSYASYLGEIVENGKVVWKDEFKADQVPETGKVSFMVPGGSLKPGRYEARLFGIVDSRRVSLGRLSFEVDGP